MVNKNARVNFSDIKDVINMEENSYTAYRWRKITVLIKKQLPLVDVVAFVDKVVENCFFENDRFSPEFKDFSIRSAMVLLYTNLDLPEDTLEQYAFVYNTDITDFIYDHINQAQFQSVVNSIDERINHMLNTRAVDIERRVDELVSYINSLKEELTTAFSGFSADDISKLFTSIAENGLDEEKLMQAYLESKSHEDA